MTTQPPGLPVTCPACDTTLYAPTAADIDAVVAAHDRKCPGPAAPDHRSASVVCPDCGKVLGTGIGHVALKKQTELLLAQHVCKSTPKAKRPKVDTPAQTAEPARLEEPPPVASPLRPTSPALIEAKALAEANPGQWVRVGGHFCKGTGSDIRRNGRGIFRTGTWEATERTIPEQVPHRVRLWIRQAAS